MTLTRCALISANLRKPFWGPIMDMVVHVLNRTYSPSLKDIPYRKLTNLKPDVTYFRKPGSIALCHIQDSLRQKLDKRAFVGILIGYDTASRSWIFLNGKTGRKVRTRHARFYERPRDPEEHIDMSSMLLQPPTFDDECRTACWRCQLWPSIL